MRSRRLTQRVASLDRARLGLAIGLASSFVASSAVAPADEPGNGDAIYRQKCAACHGANGEGTEENHPDPLVGDRPLADLTRLIDQTMPEGEPEVVSAEEAARVAAYVYDAFYSPDAQARNRPPRIELSRLTVRQYENAVTDLIGSFDRPGTWDDERGLDAEYYDDRRTRRDKRVIERRDATVDFDFGTSSPDSEKIEPHQFAIEWEGSVFAPETGDYDFVIRSEHAARLWVNDTDEPLIDAYVKSGDDTEYRKSIHLLGGRPYALRLEFSKATQGVSDKNTDKEQPPAQATISLRWKRPHHSEEVIPERCLSPNEFPETFVVNVPFPPDDRSTGYERGTSISKQWDEATTYAALQVADHVSRNLRDLAGTSRDDSDRAEKLKEFCRRFVERAFRRPLSDEQRQIFIDRQFDEASEPETAVKRVVLLTLKSPRFLYREVATPRFDAFDVASRLSFGLWDSLPDQELIDAAAKGELSTRDQIRAQAERMVGDLRARSKLRAFLHQWLGLDRMHDLAKDPSGYPEFDAIASDLRTSLELFVDDLTNGKSADYRRLLLEDTLYVNGRLAQFYGIDLPEDLPQDAPFQPVSFQPEQRAGVLTHPYLLSGLAYYSTSSPIHRGVFVARNVLGRTLAPPPEAVSPLAPDLHPDLTTRERVDLQTSAASCQTCHAMVNPLGFTLEQFDAVGRFRDQEKGRRIDATGSYVAQSGETISFAGARDLAAFLAGAEEAHEAFVEKLFSYAVKQPVRAFGADRLPELRRSFAEHGFDIRRLFAEIVTVSALPADESKERSTKK